MNVDSDCSFVDLVGQITGAYQCLQCPEEKKNVEYWLNRLGGELNKINRNEYAKNLYRFVKCGILGYPFNQPPPAGRLPEYCDIVNPRLNPYAPQPNGSAFHKDREDHHILNRLKVPECYIPRSATHMMKKMKEKCKPVSTCPPCPPLCEPIDKCIDKTHRRNERIVICSEDMKNREEINTLIDAICPTTLLEEFAAQAARFTCDKGKNMMKFISKESNNFRELVQSVFENVNKDVTRTLNEEQKRMKETYDKWERHAVAKTKTEMDFILNKIPDFSWDELRNQSNYLWFKLYPRMKKEMVACSAKSESRIRTIIQRKTWLTGVARDLQDGNSKRRADLTQLSKLLCSLSSGYLESQNKLSDHLAMMECEAESLKNRIIENQKTIENLLTEIQIAQTYKL